MKRIYFFCLAVILSALCFSGCASEESQRKLEVARTEAAGTPYSGPRFPVAVGSFDNKSAYMRGIFSDGEDRLGSQAKTLLITHLRETGRFSVLDRDNMEDARQEAAILNEAQTLKGASYLITGDVAEFGRRETGDTQWYGILGRGKKQTAYAKVSLNVIDIRTSEVVYSALGAGEAELSDREVLGFGSTSGYDSTLNGKVLDLALREAVDSLSRGIDSGEWSPSGN